MFRCCSHFLMMLDLTLSMLSPMPMTSLLRRLFLAGVERSAVVFSGLGAEQTLPVCPLQTLWPQAGGHRGCCLFKAAFRWTTDQFDGRRTRLSGERRGGGDMKGSEVDNLQLVEVRISKRPNHLLLPARAFFRLGAASCFGANRQQAAQKALIGTPSASAWHH